jgi:hypothetical protein
MAAILLIGLAACGSPAEGAPPGTSYYLASNANAVLLITWNSSGTGTITYDSINTGGSDPSAPYSLSVDSSPVGVTVNGDEVTISGFLGASFNGSLSGSTLTITSPPDTSTGQITTDTLTASDPSAYNTAVNTLNSTISTDNAQAAQAQQQAQQQQASASASAAQAAQVANDQQTAATDTQSLQGDPGNLSGDVNTLAGDVSTTANDLQTLKNDAAQGQGSPCDNLTGSVDPDATGSLAPDLTGSLEPDLNTLSNNISTARGDVQKVEADEHTLQMDNVPVPASMGQAIGAADNAVSAAISTANGDIATVMGYINSGYSIANNLAYGACAGMGPGAPPSPPGNLS